MIFGEMLKKGEVIALIVYAIHQLPIHHVLGDKGVPV